MTLLIYIIQVILGTILWKRFKFSLKDSFIFSIFVLPTIILVSVIAVELFMTKLSFVREKLYGSKNGLEKLEESYSNFIKCTGNNGNGCFMDSCGQNCNCEGLNEFGEKLKNK